MPRMQMTIESIKEIQLSKDWIEQLVSDSKKITHTDEALKRRIGQIVCAKNYFEKVSGTVLKSSLRYILGIFYINMLIAKGLFHKKIKGQFSIWDSNIDSHVSDVDFKIFINSKQVINTNSEKNIFVKSESYTNKENSIIFLKNPIYETLLFLNVKILDWIELNIKFIINIFKFLKLTFFNKDLTPIYKDFFTEPIVILYQKKGMINFYRTNSSYDMQEYWTDKINFNTVWYSINSCSIQYKSINIDNMPENPLYYFMNFGHSWTWNSNHEQWLKKLGCKKVSIAGPIMFYFGNQKNTKNKNRVIIFDVTPCEEEFIKKNVYAKGYNFYNEEYCIAFMEDILKELLTQNIEVALKPKRKFASMHSRKYINYLEEQEKKFKNFKILSATTNVFEEILDSEVVISIPFSSPYEIAKSLEKKTYYYDPYSIVDYEKMGFEKENFIIDTKKILEMVQK